MPDDPNLPSDPVDPESNDAAASAASSSPTDGAQTSPDEALDASAATAAAPESKSAALAPGDEPGEEAAALAARIAEDEGLNPDDEAATADADAQPGPDAFAMPDFGRGDASGEIDESAIDFLADVNLNVKIELGRCRMMVEDVLRLGQGSVVELEKLAGDPVDVFVNERLVARGEVLVLNDNFCVRINEIVANLPSQVGS